MDETLYLTISVIDRFLAVHQIVRKKLQLVGVTALLLACKYEEVSVPVVDDLILISDKAYTRREVLDMVNIILFVITNLRYGEFQFQLTFFFFLACIAGEANGQHLAVQFLFANSICVHETVSQSCPI